MADEEPKIIPLAISFNDLARELDLKDSKELGGIIGCLHRKVSDNPALNQRDKLLELADNDCR